FVIDAAARPRRRFQRAAPGGAGSRRATADRSGPGRARRSPSRGLTPSRLDDQERRVHSWRAIGTGWSPQRMCQTPIERADVSDKPQSAVVSTAIVSAVDPYLEDIFARELTGALTIGALDLLARTVEAYILHDRVICFSQWFDPTDYLASDRDTVRVEYRGQAVETTSPLLDPLLTPHDRENLWESTRLLRSMRHN